MDTRIIELGNERRVIAVSKHECECGATLAFDNSDRQYEQATPHTWLDDDQQEWGEVRQQEV